MHSCSLACTQSHKIYCAPKPAPINETPETSATNIPQTNGEGPQTQTNQQRPSEPFPAAVGNSSELQSLIQRYPQLRNELHEIYRASQEEEWVEWYTPQTRGRSFGRGGRGGPSRRSRGPWNAEKGFNRALGKVRKLRQDCEEGSETGAKAEAFMQFLNLVNSGVGAQAPKAS